MAVGLLALAGSAGGQPLSDPQRPARIAAGDVATLRSWAADNLETEGWVSYGMTFPRGFALAWYVSEQSDPESKYPIMREWVRFENALAPGGSRLSRTEIDCERRRQRNIEEIAYAGNNLRGRMTRADVLADASWSPVQSGSISETLFMRVCRDAR